MPTIKKKKSFFSKKYPPNSFGFDISDDSIKYVELNKKGEKISLGSFGTVNIPEGLISDGKIKDLEGLKKIILKLKKDLKIKNVSVSFPEELVFRFIIETPFIDKTEIEKKIFEIDESILEHKNNFFIEYTVLEELENTFQVLVEFANKQDVLGYVNLFKDLDIEINLLEPKAQSLSRIMIKKDDPFTYLLTDFGKNKTRFFIASRGFVYASEENSLGGKFLTSEIASYFGIKEVDAENLKKEEGIRSFEDFNLANFIIKKISPMVFSLEDFLISWGKKRLNLKQNKILVKGVSDFNIKKILLSGGGANLSNLSEYLEMSLRRKVGVVNVWQNIFDTEKDIPKMNFKESLSFAVAIGLAFESFE